MGYEDYPAARLTDIKVRAARVASLPMDELVSLAKRDPVTVNALDEGLTLACDELDVQAQEQRP